MDRLPSLLLCAVCLVPASPTLADGAGPSYRSYVLETLDRWLGANAFANPGRLVARGNFHPVAEAAACQVRAWEWTGEPRYADGAVGLLKTLVAAGGKGQEDFFIVYPLMYAYGKLEAKGRIDPDLRRDVRDFAGRNFNGRDIALHNQTLQRASGLALAAQTFPDLPGAARWRDYAGTIWGLLAETGDVTEDAPNYNQIDLMFVFVLADLLGKTDHLRAPGIAAMYRRFRDQVSPSGVVPAYGDSGNPTNDPDWPMRHGWAAWPSAFERAAAFYHDPTFRWAALEVFRTGERREPLDAPYTQAGDLFRLSFAEDWKAADLVPEEPSVGSLVQRRREPGNPEAFDKLILAPTRHEGAPFLLCDLYSRSHHAHLNQPGAIDYFESDGAPLLFMLGYNSRNPEHANLVMVREDAGSFPHAVPLFAPDRWYEAALPTSRLAEVPGAPDERHLSEFSLRVAAGRRGVTFRLDDLRLTGPAGTRVIDPGESADGWSQAPVLVSDHREGKHSLQWDLRQGVTLLTRRGPNLTFSVRDFTQVRFSWMLSNNDEQARPLIFRVPGANDQHCHALQLDPTLLDARVATHEQDQFASLRYRGWFGDDTRLTRQMVLTREGVLIVRDELLPDAGSGGRVAGPIWHLAPTAAPERGANWFNAAGGRVELLAWFATRPDQAIGVQDVDVWSRKGQQTVFARQPLEAGQPRSFITVLVPHAPDVEADALAGSIAIVEGGDATIVRVSPPKVNLSVTIGQDDRWGVQRGGP